MVVNIQTTAPEMSRWNASSFIQLHSKSDSNFVYDSYRPQRSCSKVMFSQVSVILFTGGVANTPPPCRHQPGRHPQGRHPPPPSVCWDTPPAATAADVLECILVLGLHLPSEILKKSKTARVNAKIIFCLFLFDDFPEDYFNSNELKSPFLTPLGVWAVKFGN